VIEKKKNEQTHKFDCILIGIILISIHSFGTVELPSYQVKQVVIYNEHIDLIGAVYEGICSVVSFSLDNNALLDQISVHCCLALPAVLFHRFHYRRKLVFDSNITGADCPPI
jgi:hypothetical protein